MRAETARVSCSAISGCTCRACRECTKHLPERGWRGNRLKGKTKGCGVSAAQRRASLEICSLRMGWSSTLHLEQKTDVLGVGEDTKGLLGTGEAERLRASMGRKPQELAPHTSAPLTPNSSGHLALSQGNSPGYNLINLNNPRVKSGSRKSKLVKERMNQRPGPFFLIKKSTTTTTQGFVEIPLTWAGPAWC